jgi:hypothetical protein
LTSFLEGYSRFGQDAAPDAATELGETSLSHTKSLISTLSEVIAVWAVELANKLFRESIEQLNNTQWVLTDESLSGQDLASANHCCSHFLAATPNRDAINQNLIDFVRNAARLRVETFVKAAASTGARSSRTQGESSVATTPSKPKQML